MRLRTLLWRSLCFHWRSHLGVVSGAAIGSAALIGALIVGDSVKGSLRERALQRLGNTVAALNAGDRLLQEATVRQLEPVPKALTAPALLLPASAARTDGQARVNQVNLVGVEESFWRLAPARPAFDAIRPGHLVLNRVLARSLGITEAGGEVLVRTRSPSALALDSALSAREAGAVALRLKVQAVVGDEELGAFSLRQSATPPANAFVRLEELAEAAGCPGRVNLGLAGMLADALPVPENFAANADAELARAFTLADSESTIENVPQAEHLELRTPRVFLDPPVVQAALAADTNALPLLTYLANLITTGTNAAPYSMVTAAGAPWTPPGLRDDEIVLNQWLAEDLRAKPGDTVTLVYYDPESGARLTERTNTFRVHSIVPMEMPWADRTLMPQFPGIEKAETTADWDTAFPLVYPIRPQDDDYWTEWRGTPKAFVTLAAGQKMWANRFGDLTAIRFLVPTNWVELVKDGGSRPLPADGAHGVTRPTNSASLRAALEKKILATLKPEALGLRFEPVREQALKAADQSQDFGGLFIGFSLFVIVAALLLMALLFRFSLEQRTAEIGTLLALGFTPRQVLGLFLREGAALALLGGVLGTLGGVGYARAMLHGLTTLWSDAVGGSALTFFVTPQTLVIGLLASTGVAVFTLWLALRKQARQPARSLLVGADGGLELEGGGARRVQGTAIASGALLAAVGLVGWTLAKGDTANAGAFFGAGALVLIAGLSFLNAQLARRYQPSSILHLPSIRTLARRGLARRRSRSVATAAMLASGAFLIVSIGVFRLDANRDASKRTSGTGGFALIGESTLPVVADLNKSAGRETFALNEADLADVQFVQFRVRAGDEASCLNLNRAQKPRLLGVNPDSLAGRFTFVKGAGWSALRDDPAHQADLLARTDEVPAIGDAASIQWAMGKKVGDTLDYVDERGQPFRVRIVGAVANSILQGQLLIDEAEFVRRFPGESGYKYFLIDAPTNRVADVSAKLARALQDLGLELTPAPRRLAQFNAVQNTYLGTFQILGGLGLLLGSAGLGIVVLRNVLERRGELAVLLAVGWRRAGVNRLVLWEHLALLGLGLAIGLVAAFVAVLPAALTPGAEFPWLTLGLTLAAVLANGVVWTWLATRAALRGELLAALRND